MIHLTFFSDDYIPHQMNSPKNYQKSKLLQISYQSFNSSLDRLLIRKKLSGLLQYFN